MKKKIKPVKIPLGMEGHYEKCINKFCTEQVYIESPYQVGLCEKCKQQLGGR